MDDGKRRSTDAAFDHRPRFWREAKIEDRRLAFFSDRAVRRERSELTQRIEHQLLKPFRIAGIEPEIDGHSTSARHPGRDIGRRNSPPAVRRQVRVRIRIMKLSNESSATWSQSRESPRNATRLSYNFLKWGFVCDKSA